jgi:riboflavin biosynthesis pyrimidine reductase
LVYHRADEGRGGEDVWTAIAGRQQGSVDLSDLDAQEAEVTLTKRRLDVSRPRIVVISAASLDGRMALGPDRTQWDELDDPRNAEPYGAGGAWEDAVQRIEEVHHPGAGMQGSGSFVTSRTELRPLPPFEGDPDALHEDFLPAQVVHDPELKKWLVVVDGQGRMRSGYKGDEEAGTRMLHLVSHAVPAGYLAFLRREGIPYLIAGERWVDLPVVMRKLRTELEVTCVLSMAGGRLNGALLRAGLVDEVNVLFTPRLIGGFETPSLFDSPELGEEEWPTPL